MEDSVVYTGESNDKHKHGMVYRLYKIHMNGIAINLNDPTSTVIVNDDNKRVHISKRSEFMSIPEYREYMINKLINTQ